MNVSSSMRRSRIFDTVQSLPKPRALDELDPRTCRAERVDISRREAEAVGSDDAEVVVVVELQ